MIGHGGDEALGDLNVPYFAMAVSSARNLHRVWRGRMPLSDLPFSLVLDATVKGGLSAVGALSGKALGLLAFGPAGALVLGGVGGVGALVGAGGGQGSRRLACCPQNGSLKLIGPPSCSGWRF
jgi:hypothetical protein